jgi:cysteine-rich repeat protein
MRKLQSRWALLTCVAVLAACDGTTPGVDGGPTDAPMQVDSGRDGGNVCTGRDLCPTAGTSCDGDNLVTCARDADGCLVRTRTDCGADGDVCAGTPAACVDACSLIPAEDRCDTDGARACDGNTLEICTMDAGGCLVLQRTVCDAMPDGFCNASGAMPICDLPPDPCEMIPAAERCTTAGTTCDGTSIVECAPNAIGCLVTTRTDCSERASGTCDPSGGTAQCVFTGDPCEGITQCSTPGARCDGPVLVECDADAFGCFVETRTTCTDMTFGFCDADATPRAQCSTAATDPCMGVAQCGTAPGRSCADATTLSVCSANAFGCFVATPTDCSTDGDVCSAASGTAMCVDPCSLVTTCAAPNFCAGDSLVTCAPDANGCLVESMRTPCTGTCAGAGGSAACVDTACPRAEPVVLNCDSGTVMGTTVGAPSDRANYAPCSTLSHPGPERIYRFRHTGTTPVEVRVVATRATGTADYDLFAWQAGEAFSTACLGTIPAGTCLGTSTGTSATETVTFGAQPNSTAYIAYDRFGTSTETPAFTLAISCTPLICGDGAIGAGEQCDDSNARDGDGCSGTCQREPGFSCTGTPSTCTFVCGNGVLDTAAGETCDDGNRMGSDGCSATCTTETGYTCVGVGPGSCSLQAPNALCGAPTPLTAPGVFDEDLRAGGPRPTGTNCGTTPGLVRYYSVTVPANSSVTVTGQPIFTSWDITLRSLADCSGNCLGNVNAQPAGGNETLTLLNTTGSAVTRLVAVGANSATDLGRYNLTISAPRELPAHAACGGARTVTASTSFAGENTAEGGTSPTGTTCGTAGGPTFYYNVTIPPNTRVNTVVTGGTGFDPVVKVLTACDATDCSSRTNATSTAGTETVNLDNGTSSPITRIVAVNGNATGATGTYGIQFNYAAIAPHGTCVGARTVTASTSFAGENTVDGGASPTGTTCGSVGGPTYYYNVTIPPNTRVNTVVMGGTGFDAVVKVLTACDATSCVSRTDATFGGGTETVNLENTTASDITRIVAVNGFGTGSTGTYGVVFTYTVLPCGNGVIDAGETCDDSNRTAGDGCSSGCQVETDFSCVGAPSVCTRLYTRTTISTACLDVSASAPLTTTEADDGATSINALPFSFPFFGTTVTHYSVTTNGFAQLYTSATGTASTAFSNVAIPASAEPNGFIAPYWDDLEIAGGIRAANVGGTFVIEWAGARLFLGSENMRFQAQILPSGTIELHYCELTGAAATGAGATIGIENLTGTAGSQQSFNTAGSAATSVAYRFTPNP